MALPDFSMRQLLEAGVHFGHRASRWNPKMKPMIFGVRNGVHILDLQQTVPALKDALKFLRDTAANGGRILFVGTKRQAQEKIAEAAKRSGQFYVNHRWLGGMMTNWGTISKSIKRLGEIEAILAGDTSARSKKELLMIEREREKLEKVIGGIREMGGKPDAIFVVDVNKEDIAILEANKLGIPVVGVLDSNSNPEGVDFPFPGNDDAIRAVELYCDLAVAAILDGVQVQLSGAKQKDPGEATDVKVNLPKTKAAEKADASKESGKTADSEDKEEAKDVKKAASA